MTSISAWLQAIPEAASDPFALIAYAVALIVAAYAGFRLRELQQVLRTLQTRPSTSDSQMVEVIKVVTQRPVPPKMTGAQWIRYQKLQAGLLIAIALIIAFLTLAVVAIVQTTDKPSQTDTSLVPDKPSQIDPSRITVSFPKKSRKLSTMVQMLNQFNMGFNVHFDESVPDEKKNQWIEFDGDLNNLQLPIFIDLLCDRAGDLTCQIHPSSRTITLSTGGDQ